MAMTMREDDLRDENQLKDRKCKPFKSGVTCEDVRKTEGVKVAEAGASHKEAAQEPSLP